MKNYLNKIYISLILLLIAIIPMHVKALGFNLKKSSLILGVGLTEKLNYTIEEELNSSDIIWKSSDPSVATVENGIVTAISEGSAIITASINGISSTCKVTVSSSCVSVTGITLNKSSMNILIGNTEALTKKISPSNATNQDVTWKSSDQDIATVSSDGLITAKKVGTTIITVTTNNGYKTTCRVTVVDTIALKEISLNKKTLIIKEKETETLKVNFNPSTATNKKVTWKSSNTSVATVNSSGKVTGIAPGNATITVVSNDGGFVATTKVTVEAISKKVVSISLDKKELTLVSGETSTLKHTINPDYAENKNVTWTSADEKIAIVENGKITAMSVGTTEIKVISEDGNKEAVCKLTVTLPPIKGMSFAETEKTVYIGDKFKLTPINDPINSILETAIWTTSNELIANVENGKVTALSKGETIITVSNEDNTISASIKIIVIEKPKEKLNITIEGYDLDFKPEIKYYSITINNEKKLTIKTNVDEEKVTINGNQNLKDGSIITITINDGETVTYIINIKEKQNYTIYFIAILSVLLLINLLRILKKKK